MTKEKIFNKIEKLVATIRHNKTSQITDKDTGHTLVKKPVVRRLKLNARVVVDNRAGKVVCSYESTKYGKEYGVLLDNGDFARVVNK